MLECVPNVSEGRDRGVLDVLGAACGGALLDRHADADHNRAVFTLLGEEAVRPLTEAALERLDLRIHAGAHPRLGVVDVVPFVPLGTHLLDDALTARDAFASWAASELGLPCFLYGPERSLPEIRRRAFVDFLPDTGPPVPHPTAGACCVGARPVLVAYNVWLAEPDLDVARRIAADLRGPYVRTLALLLGQRVQVSTNLLEPLIVGPDAVYDAVAAVAPVSRAELVGLAPRAVLDAIAPERWGALDLGPERTIEARVSATRWPSGAPPGPVDA
jgi:glutamate formiminotransferase